MKLGIPTLNNYAGVNALIASAEAGSVSPESYVIIDNGGSFPHQSEFGTRCKIIRNGRNLGVAAAWNELLRGSPDEPVVISNDDIIFGKDTFRMLRDAALEHPFVGAAGGWALFAQNPECTKAVGFYDERFYPAYYEDCDYLLRMRRAGVPIFDLGWAGATHLGEITTKTASESDRALIADGRARNYSYFVTKWGSDSPRWGDPHVSNFPEPFNGRFQGHFQNEAGEPRLERTHLSPMRYDVLNFIAELTGAKRYLEIGVSDGDNMRRVNVAEKWGVDPVPQPSGVSACSVFVPRTSDFFFQTMSDRAGKFDLVFIDGDHRAEQVYREVHYALPLLSPRAVICLHDCSPHTEAMQEVPHRTGWQWTGDVWKAVARLRSEGLDLRVIPSDFGVGFLIPTDEQSPQVTLPAEWDRLLWRDLVADRENLLGLLRPGEWQSALRTLLGA